MGQEFDLLTRTMALIDTVLAEHPRAKVKVEQACQECVEMELADPRPTFHDGTHAHCPDCGCVFETETYPYCKPCRVRWD